jgi:hypothetical protein
LIEDFDTIAGMALVKGEPRLGFSTKGSLLWNKITCPPRQ